MCPRSTAQLRPKILAISSGGGHWIELRRLKPAFRGCNVVWCTTHVDYRSDVEADDEHEYSDFFIVTEANRWRKSRLIKQFLGVAWVLIKTRPKTIVSTGAAPGVFAICLGKTLFRAHTVWVQSIADTEQMSMSGKLVRRFSDLWLTQWEHVARPEGPTYYGAVV